MAQGKKPPGPQPTSNEMEADEEEPLQIDEDGDKLLCRECGVRNRPGLKLCINCGGRLIPDEII